MQPLARLMVSAILLCSLALAAIAPAAAQSHVFKHGPATKRHATPSVITLRVWDPFTKGSRERAALQRVVQGWERQTGYRVSLGGYAGNNYLKICAAAPAGQGPDLVAITHDQLGELSSCFAIQPVPGWAWPASQQRQYVPASVMAGRINGQEWGMPWSIETPGVYYNTALISPRFFTNQPLPWSRVIARAKALTNPKKQTYGLAWAVTNFYLDYGIVSASGGYVFKATSKGFDLHSLGVDSRGTIAGLQFIRDLTTDGKYHLVPAKMSSLAAKYLFTHRKVAMFITGPWDQDTFRELRVRYGFTPMPSIGSHPSHPFSTVGVFSVNKRTKHSRQAFSLLRYLTTNMQLPEFHTSGQMPVVKQYLRSGAVQRDPVARGEAQAALTAEAVPNLVQMTQVWVPMTRALGNVVGGVQSPSDAAHDAASQIRKSIGS